MTSTKNQWLAWRARQLELLPHRSQRQHMSTRQAAPVDTHHTLKVYGRQVINGTRWIWLKTRDTSTGRVHTMATTGSLMDTHTARLYCRMYRTTKLSSNRYDRKVTRDPVAHASFKHQSHTAVLHHVRASGIRTAACQTLVIDGPDACTSRTLLHAGWSAACITMINYGASDFNSMHRAQPSCTALHISFRDFLNIPPTGTSDREDVINNYHAYRYAVVVVDSCNSYASVKTDLQQLFRARMLESVSVLSVTVAYRGTAGTRAQINSRVINMIRDLASAAGYTVHASTLVLCSRAAVVTWVCEVREVCTQLAAN